MACIYRRQQNFDKEYQGIQVGPGQYHVENKKQKRNNYVPFNVSSSRIDETSLKTDIPGPGFYVYDIQESLIDIIDNESSVFKSATTRFPHRNENSIDEESQFIERPKVKGKIMKQMQVCKEHNPTPSIPLLAPKIDKILDHWQTNLHNLSLSQDQYQNMSYSQNQLSREHKFFNPIKNTTNNNVGPGTYSTDVSLSLNRCQQSSCFISRTSRLYQDPQQNNKSNNLMNKLKSEALLLASGPEEVDAILSYHKTNDTVHLLFQELTPGPGEYTNSLHRDVPGNKNATFGSTCERFEETHQQTFQGPADYNKKIQNKKSYNKALTQIPKEKRLQEGQRMEKTPGPGSYEYFISIQQKAKENLLKSKKRHYQQQFPVEEDVLFQYKQVPGPGYYTLDEKWNKKQQKELYTYKSTTSQIEPIRLKAVPDLGTYYKNDQFKSIEKKQTIQQNPKFQTGKFKIPKNDGTFLTVDEVPWESLDALEAFQKENIIHKRQKQREQVYHSNFGNVKRDPFKVNAQHENGPGSYNLEMYYANLRKSQNVTLQN